MTLLEKLDSLKKTTGDTNASLARNSGIPYTTIDGLYKKGYTNMKLSTIQALCDYFDVSLDYLAKDEIDQPEKKYPAPEPSSSERDEITALYGALSEENQKRLLDYAQVLLKAQQAEHDSQA